MNWIKLAVVFALVVAWCGGAVKETGSDIQAGDQPVGDRTAGDPSVGIDSVVLSFRQGGDGKEPETGFRVDIDAGMEPGASVNPVFTVYTCGTENQPFESHSTATIILKPAPNYKGKPDLAALEKSGGHIHIWPICYLPNSGNGVDYDLWDITNVTMRISGWKGSLVWNMDGPKMLVLSSQSGNEADLYFDAGLNPQERWKR
jgi:hypothetical protein